MTTLSELITKSQALLSEHGDLVVLSDEYRDFTMDVEEDPDDWDKQAVILNQEWF